MIGKVAAKLAKLAPGSLWGAFSVEERPSHQNWLQDAFWEAFSICPGRKRGPAWDDAEVQKP